MHNPNVMVLGAGGHAKVVIRTLELLGYQIVGVFDDDPSKCGKFILGYPVQGALEEALDTDCRNAVLAIGDNAIRQRAVERLGALNWITAVHPDAWVDPSAVLGNGVMVFAGAVIQADAVIGDHVIINTCASVDHDCLLGDFVHVAPGAHLAGQVTVGAGVLIGIGGVAAPGTRIGDWSVIGAGGSVVEDIPAHVVAMGVPARPMRRVKD